MRTLTIHTADDLLTRWKRKAANLNEEADRQPDDRLGRHLAAIGRQESVAYRVCAAELAAIVAVSMELEAAHHGDPEPEPTGPFDNLIDPTLANRGPTYARAATFAPADDDDEPGLLIRCDEEIAANALMDWSQGRRP